MPPHRPEEPENTVPADDRGQGGSADIDRHDPAPGHSATAAEHHSRPSPEQVEQARRGDRAAQQALWHTHRRWVATIVLAHRPRAVDVEDLMQDVAVKFVSRVHTLRDARAFRPWLRQIIINVCRGAARDLKPTLSLSRSDSDGTGPRVANVQPPVAHENNGVNRLADRDDARRLLDQAMTLPPEYREPLLLRCVQSMSYRQIGDLLGLPMTTVETRLARARRMLRDELGDEQ